MSYSFGTYDQPGQMFLDRKGNEVKDGSIVAMSFGYGDGTELRIGKVIRMIWTVKMHGCFVEKVKMQWIDPVLKDSTLQGLDSRRVLVLE